MAPESCWTTPRAGITVDHIAWLFLMTATLVLTVASNVLVQRRDRR